MKTEKKRPDLEFADQEVPKRRAPVYNNPNGVPTWIAPKTKTGGLVMKNYKRFKTKRKMANEQKMDNSLMERIRSAGAEHFGILVMDSSKGNYQPLLGNYLGEKLVDFDPVQNTRPALENFVVQVKKHCKEFKLNDLVVGLERTGRYHLPAKQILEKYWTAKIIHPCATKQLRCPVKSGNKTDGTDKDAMLKAMVAGYGMHEPELPETWVVWRIIGRMRNDLVGKRATIKVQSQELMEALIPGYTRLFDDIWNTGTAIAVIRVFGTAEKILAAGPDKIRERLEEAGISSSLPAIQRIHAWASQASPCDPGAGIRHKSLIEYLDMISDLEGRIGRLETELLGFLAGTPAVLLLGIKGIGPVSASGYGSELGPIENYSNSKKITGRGGIYPSRYQSDKVDLKDGPLVRNRNARLRHALMGVADNLLKCNPSFKAWRGLPEHAGMSWTEARVVVANRFARISFAMLANRAVFDHPTMPGRDAIIAKIIAYGRESKIPVNIIYDAAIKAVEQIPPNVYHEELEALEMGRWRRKTILPGKPARKSAGRPQRPEYITKIMAWLETLAQHGGNIAVHS
jgi:hypothetical protein